MSDPRQAVSGAVSFIVVVVLALLPVFLGGSAGAQTVDPFTVEDVAIDATAGDTEKARRKALAAGQARAYVLVLRRLAHSKDVARLPKPPPPIELANLIEGISVRQEKSSKIRYLALLTVRFKPERIRTILKLAGIDFVDTPSRPVVVLPIYRAGNRLLLWEDPNPWRAAWNKVPLKGGLVAFTLALGDLADVQAIDARGALARKRTALAALASRYKAGEVLIALADETGGSADHPALRITLWRFDALTGKVSRAGRRRAVRAASRDDTFVATAKAVARAIERRWKSENQAIIGGEPREIRVYVPIESLGQWTEVRDRVRKVRVVKDTRVLRLSRERAILSIMYVGDLRRLRVGLAQQNIALVERAGMSGGGNGSTNGAGGTTSVGGEPSYELRFGGGVATGNGSTAPKSKTDP